MLAAFPEENYNCTALIHWVNRLIPVKDVDACDLVQIQNYIQLEHDKGKLILY